MPVLAEGTVRYSNVKAGLLVSLVHFYTFGHAGSLPRDYEMKIR